jgi:hypothetical protein
LFNDFNGSYHDSLFVRYGALEGRDGVSGKYESRASKSHSTCCVALMLAFFAELNRDPEAMAQARDAATECERKDA